MESFLEYASPIGPMILAGEGEGITGAWFLGQKYFAPGRTISGMGEALPVLSQGKAWLDAYFSGETLPPMPSLAPRGTAFQQSVWKILRTIPSGETMTYGEIAAQLGSTRESGFMSAQAVGGAVGHNPISIFIPCHRVLGAGGRLTGYAGGLEKKAFLLNLEGAAFIK